MSYTVLGDTYSLGLGIAFDKNRFELIDTHESKYNEKLKNGPGFFVAYLYDNEHQKVIALINTHLRGAYNAWNIKKQQLLNIKNYINNNKNAAQAWIVCGNFNIHFSTRETYEEFRKETFSRDTGWVDIDPVMQCNKKEKTPWLMTANTIDMGRKTVRRATKKERLDYLFFTGPLIKKEYRISSNNFLECDIRDKETNHYSHHGALLATFSWPEKEYLQWEEIMDKVPSKYQELVDGLPIN
jgi:hypothetical protein